MSKDDATWLNVGYLVFAALVAFFTYKAIELVGIQTNWIEAFEWYNIAATIGAVVVAAGLTYWLRGDAERHDYLLSCIGELRKVTWPTWADTKRMTMIVVVVVAIFAVIVSVFDAVWARALKFLIA